MENFGEGLRKIRRGKNLTLRDVEKKSGISNSYLSQIEQGKRGIPSISLLTKLDDAFNLQRGDLCKYALTLDADWTIAPNVVTNVGGMELPSIIGNHDGSENVHVPANEIEDIRKKYSELTPENRKQVNSFLSFLLDGQQKQSLK